MSKKHKTVRKITSIALSLTTTLWLVGVGTLVPFAAHAATVEELQAQIQNLLSLIAGLQVQLAAVQGGTPVTACTFTRNLFMGVSGDDVQCLQRYLNSAGHTVASSGVGSPGNETKYFGSLTKAAAIKWQNANAASVLTPLGLGAGTGYWGNSSRSHYSALVAAAPPVVTPPGTPPVVVPPGVIPAPAGTLKVEAGSHPAASLFPTNATRLPFTQLKFTAPLDQDVTVTSLVVERTGLANDSAFGGVVLVDENGVQLGIAKTLNSVHQATLTEDFVVKAGQSRTMTLAGNASTDNTNYTGQIAYLSLVSVNTTVPVSGSLPVTGVGHTVNASLTIGSVTMVRGSLDPGSTQTKRVGTTGYTFSAVKLTAGSAEKVFLKSIRWNQTGSVAGSDLSSIKTYVDSVGYDHTISADGKYYTATFNGEGIEIKKGFSKEISVKGDIAGGSGRTIDFDLAKRVDLNIVGQLYGFGITPPQTGSSDPTDDTAAFSSVEDPWYDAAQVLVSAGAITIANSNTVPAQNIAVNLADQVLGAVKVTVKGEEISVGRIGFNVTLGTATSDAGTGADIDDITNIVLVDASGTVVAGPVDGTAADSANTSGSGDGSVVFTDTVTFPVGENVYTLKGKIGTDIGNNIQVQASTTPNNDWAGTVTGQITGNSVTPGPSSAITLNAMTVKAGTLAISVSSIPIAQTAIAGSSDFLFAQYIIDATASGEDIRLTSIPLEFNPATGNATDLTDCDLFDGSVDITSTQNPSARASATSFIFDGGGLTIPKGTAKTIGLKCDIISGATGSYYWGLDSGQATSYTGATGLTSGSTTNETMTDSIGQKMTAASGGSLTVAKDSSAPGYQVANANQTGVILNKIRFSAANEDVDLKQLALQLTTTASNTPDNLVGRKVTLWNGSSLIGEATFTGANSDYATSSAIAAGAFTIPRDSSKILTIKGDLANISLSGPMTFSGDLLKVDYDGGNVGLNGNYGTGLASGNTINGGSSDTAITGTRLFAAYPKLARVSMTSTERTPTAGTTADFTLYKFKVTAVGGDIALAKFSFSVSSSTGSVANSTTTLYSLYSYGTDSGFSAVDSSFSATGLLNASQCARSSFSNDTEDMTGRNGEKIGTDPQGGGNIPIEIFIDASATSCNTAVSTTTYTIPSGQTYHFRLAATISGVEGVTGTETFQVGLLGDAAFPTRQQGGSGATDSDGYSGSMGGLGIMGDRPGRGVDDDAEDDFIWSPISTTTAISVNDVDFTNGYLLPGLPTTNMTLETFTSPN